MWPLVDNHAGYPQKNMLSYSHKSPRFQHEGAFPFAESLLHTCNHNTNLLMSSQIKFTLKMIKREDDFNTFKFKTKNLPCF
jgi:hypothetical protein